MSQNCQAYSTTRDANNNTLYHSGTSPSYGERYTPPSAQGNGTYHQVTAKVLFGSVKTINDLKRQEKTGRDDRRKH